MLETRREPASTAMCFDDMVCLSRAALMGQERLKPEAVLWRAAGRDAEAADHKTVTS